MASDPSTAQRVVLASRPEGAATLDNFRLETVPIPQAPPDGMLLKARYLSLDPYMRGRMDEKKSYARPARLGEAMPGEAVAEVVESNHPGFARGDMVLAHMGWQTHAASDGKGVRKVDAKAAPLTTRLGVLGMPGFTAWSGLMLIGKPVAGQTVAVAAASGPVGSLVGQLARRSGCRAVGIAGGAEKCAYVRDELGFDAAVDHRAPDFAAQLAAACPDGVDVYFENVGGAVWQAVLPLLNPFARVPVCGLIAQYDTAAGAQRDHLPQTMRAILSLSLTIRGYINYEFAEEHFAEFLDSVTPAVASGEIKHREDMTRGLANAPAAFLGMLRGKNFGKVIVDMQDAG
jgi:NADPH-dependent curcumin reductase CurA